MRGSAVELKIACCVVEGGCTWSKVNICFLPEVADEVDAAAAVLEPTDEGVEDVASTETLVEDTALMTVLWNRAGMEEASWLVGGRIRRAVGTQSCERAAKRGPACVLTYLDRGRRTVRRRR